VKYLRALAFNCTLKSSKSGDKSSTEVLLGQLLRALKTHGVEGEILRAVDFNIKPGVLSDEGPGDAWPELRKRVVEADILIMGSPIWLGQPSSVCKRVLERMDAFLDEAACLPTERSPLWPWLETKMAPTMLAPSCSRRSLKSASPSRRAE
jgi:hypothetical protein